MTEETVPAWGAIPTGQPESPEKQYGDVEAIKLRDDYKPNKPSILAEADTIINGPRNDAYGDATPAFTEYAKGASVIFGVEVNAKQVALFMTWLKVCRELHKPQRDNRVDAAGYLGLADQIEEHIR